MEFYGKVKFIGNVDVISEKLTKRTVVFIENNPEAKYPASVAVDFINDKVALTNDLKVDDVCTAHMNFRANESKSQPGKFFNSISCWRLDTTKDSDVENESAF